MEGVSCKLRPQKHRPETSKAARPRKTQTPNTLKEKRCQWQPRDC